MHVGRISRLPLFTLVIICATFMSKFWATSKEAINISWLKRRSAFARRTNRTEEDPIYILDWTSFYGQFVSNSYLTVGCPSLPCRLTHDRRLLSRSAAVVFHPSDTMRFDVPLWRSPDQSYVMTLWESPSMMNGNWPSVDVGFNLTMTYRYDSDIVAPYGRLVRLGTERVNESHHEDQMNELMKKKSKLVAWIVSNCKANSHRERLVEEMKKYLPVDVYGKCGTLTTCQKFACDELRVIEEYKFYLSFENSVCKDYLTEKFYDRLQQNAVPIVLGGAGNFAERNDQRYPPNGYIVATNFTSVKELVEYLLHLDSHPEEYLRYFQWKRRYRVISTWREMIVDAYCQLCRRLLWIDEDPRRRRKTYADIVRWWESPPCDNEFVTRFLAKGKSY